MIAEAKNLFDGINRLLATSPSRILPKPVPNPEPKNVAENGVVENGILHNNIERTESGSIGENKERSVSPEKEVKTETEDTPKSPVS